MCLHVSASLVPGIKVFVATHRLFKSKVDPGVPILPITFHFQKAVCSWEIRRGEGRGEETECVTHISEGQRPPHSILTLGWVNTTAVLVTRSLELRKGKVPRVNSRAPKEPA